MDLPISKERLGGQADQNPPLLYWSNATAAMGVVDEEQLSYTVFHSIVHIHRCRCALRWDIHTMLKCSQMVKVGRTLGRMFSRVNAK